jgi:hypothetical protein
MKPTMTAHVAFGRELQKRPRWSAISARATMAAMLAFAGVCAVSGETVQAQTYVPTSMAVPAPQLVLTRRGPVRHTKSSLVALASAPFPYRGVVPSTNRPFLEAMEDGRLGHKLGNGHVYFEDQTYSDNRVLLHLPKGFDARRPGLIIVFFHGHGANIVDDVFARQQVPSQISKSGVNAVLIAPQLAVNAADSSAGKLWQRGGLSRMLDEASLHLGRLYGDSRATRAFKSMPVVIVAYSGGYVSAAYSLSNGGLGKRLRGVVLLDALYGELGKFNTWLMKDASVFLISAYARSTRSANERLMTALKERNIPFDTAMAPRLRPGSLTFIDTGDDASHRNFVTQAWAQQPIADMLKRMNGFRRR